MSPVLEGLTVIDLSTGIAGAVTTMLLADYGAEVIKVEAHGGDPFRGTPGYDVWSRGKHSVVLDLHTEPDHAQLSRFLAASDVCVHTYSHDEAEALGLADSTLGSSFPELIVCAVSAYGRSGPLRDRPAEDGLVQARAALQNEQPGLRPGPVYLHTPLPSMGAALLASTAITAALHARELTGRGQVVETSLMQGAMLWLTQLRKRAEHPTAELINRWMFKDLGPTPCFEAADGLWLHPMPWGVPVALAYVGRDPASLPVTKLDSAERAEKAAYFDRLRDLYLQKPRDEWLELFRREDLPCEPVTPVDAAFRHPQLVHNGAVITVERPATGAVTQFGHAYRLERHEHAVGGPAPAIGEHTASVLGSLDGRTQRNRRQPSRALEHALDGIRVLDFGTALAGPFGAMVLADLGADVIKIDPVDRVGSAGDSTYAGCQRGKRSLSIDLKRPEARGIVSALIARSDVIHYNLRTGVAERLGFGYEQAKAINPGIIFCHLTGYGNTGPYARIPGVDQMGQALCGLEYEQGATPNGGHPTWLRFGMCDATSGTLSALGVLQALYHRDRTGEGQAIDVDIVSGGMFLASDAVLGPHGVERAHLDQEQTGFGPLHRLYLTADGWLCIVARTEQQWLDLAEAIGAEELCSDPRFTTPSGRDDNADALAKEIGARLAASSATDWFARLDARRVPCEISSETWQTDWVDDPVAIASGWVADYEHPVWGRFEQPGRFFELAATPGRIAGPPPVIGWHSTEILSELGYSGDEIDSLRAARVVAQ